jgi:methionyl-tRNA formyltransferase
MGFINLHHSYMLSFRGRDMTTHAIINARKTNRWYHGTTIHYTDDGLDTGPIIASDSCPITEHDTAWSLFEKTESLGRAMLDLWLPRIVGGRPPLATPEPEQPLNLRSDKSTKAISDIFSDPLESYDLVRAYDFNGYYEPASTVIRGDKVYLTTRGDAGGEVLLALGENRSIYKMAHRSAN